jgi:hypothetical protein
VVARGKLGHDTAIRRVQINLAVDLVREQARDAVVDGNGRFVTGGFDAENPHALQFLSALSKIRGPFSR